MTEAYAAYREACHLLAAHPAPIAASFLADMPAVEDLDVENTVFDFARPDNLLATLVPNAKNGLLNIASAAVKGWSQPYEPNDLGIEFHTGSAWWPIAGSRGPLIWPDGLLELLFLGAGIHYPRHWHTPEEIYLVLAGDVLEQTGDDNWMPRMTGELIHNPSNIPHALRAGPMGAALLTIWRGGVFEMPIFPTSGDKR